MTEITDEWAMKLWRAACGVYEDAGEPDDTLRTSVIKGDTAAATLIKARVSAQMAERDALRDALREVVPSLAAAVSLLQRGGKAAKKAAPSDKMFDQMVRDYKNSLERARQALRDTHEQG